MSVKIIDTATPFIKYAAKAFPNEIRKSVKSSGWWMQQNIKQGIAAGAPGGMPYEPITGLGKLARLSSRYRKAAAEGKDTSRFKRKYQRVRSGADGKTRKPLGRLGAAVRYIFFSDSIRTIVGWVSPSAEKLGQLHEAGGSHEVSTKERKAWFASGRGLSSGKTTIYLPRRPTIDPSYRKYGPQTMPYIEKKIFQFITKAEVRTG